jgi:hypothetical protein
MPLTAAISPNQPSIQTAMRAFLLDVLGGYSPDVVVGQGNRVPEPTNPIFVVMTPLRFGRLDTNLDISKDVKFIGSVAAQVLTVTTLSHGLIVPGTFLYGVNVADNTVIQSQLTGAPGGTGTYQISVSQTVAQEILSSGYRQFTQTAKATVQLDFHSADFSAGDMAQTLSTAFRSEYGTSFFAGIASGITPLYADDPKERPFINAENQYEWRWGLDACMQVDQVIAVGQQFMDSVKIARIAVDAFFAP